MNHSTARRGRSASGTVKRTVEAIDPLSRSCGFKAMVVDDDPIMLKLASAMLAKLGYQVFSASEGTDALFHLHRKAYDLVLTDYYIPAINGYQLGRSVKTRSPGTRVVIMTGLERSAVAALINTKEIDGWLFKPFYLEDLKALLCKLGLPVEDKVEP